MDNLTPLMSERFELLSAYLDGEVSPAERKQVEAWLSSDAELQQTYRKMLTLQSGFKSMPVEAGVMPTDQFVDQVMKRLDRRPRLWVWGGLGAATAIVVGAFSGLMGNQGVFEMAQKHPSTIESPQTALSTSSHNKVASNHNGAAESNDPTALMIALDRPPVVIPAVPASMTTKSSGLESATDF